LAMCSKLIFCVYILVLQQCHVLPVICMHHFNLLSFSQK